MSNRQQECGTVPVYQRRRRTAVADGMYRGARSAWRAIAALELQMITAALNEWGNNRSEAARLLGFSRGGLLKKLERLGLR